MPVETEQSMVAATAPEAAASAKPKIVRGGSDYGLFAKEEEPRGVISFAGNDDWLDKTTQADVKKLLRDEECSLDDLKGFLKKCSDQFKIRLASGGQGEASLNYTDNGEEIGSGFNDNATAVRQAFKLCEKILPAGAFKEWIDNKKLPQMPLRKNEKNVAATPGPVACSVM